MRYAIFGDIHGNTEALGAVLLDMERAGADRRICLGDVVGYGAEPGECVRTVRDAGIETVQGNHDSAAIGETPLDYFNPYAKKAIEWTSGAIGADESAWLRRLPLTIEGDGFTVVHSSLSRPREWGYILDWASARRCFDLLSSTVCFIGHSHVPIIFKKGEDGSIADLPELSAPLAPPRSIYRERRERGAAAGRRSAGELRPVRQRRADGGDQARGVRLPLRAEEDHRRGAARVPRDAPRGGALKWPD